MNEAKFTKGPWRLKQSNGGRLHLISKIGAQIAAFWNCNERDANAHLIAAAPEMYEMIEDFKDFAISQGWKRSIVTAAEELLAKARGELAE